ncbi:heme biosynthesis HemY N-terminal domain-containing protein [Pleionea sediminis]|uniref:heme biosynthesis HemY N-terminal domain-containing protein n=1 Tax=Pleionea sediminis TaxID=2569479 RepID=UPI001184D1C1|nr:heme biosynthesis HemY N-terminal domain-containing protein [Pleionea sediminis]
MKLVRLGLLAIIVGAIMAWIIKSQEGFVILAWDKHAIEMRLWLFGALLLMLIIAISVLSWFFMSVKRSGRQLKRWKDHRGEKKSRNQTLAGLIALTEGRFEKAEQLFNKSAEKAENRLINYLLAAKAAQEQKDFVKRDDYLQQAAENEPDANIAVSVTQADLQYESGQFEHALASLAQLWGHRQRHPYVLKLLGKCYYRLKDWTKLYDLLPEIKKNQILNTDHFLQIEFECTAELLKLEAQKGCEQLQQRWQSLSSEYQKNRRYVCVYAQLLIELGAKAEAEAILRSTLKRGYHHDLIYWYGSAAGRDNKSQLNFAESFKAEGANDWQLHSTLGQLSFHNELWGKAKEYLSRSIQIKPNLESYRLLVKTLEKLGETNDQLNRLLSSALEYAFDESHPRLLNRNTENLLTSE